MERESEKRDKENRRQDQKKKKQVKEIKQKPYKIDFLQTQYQIEY